MSGFVSLVGAGPGNPELLTLLGKRRLQEADVVVYDRLVNPALLSPLMAEKIDVGKLPHHHKFSQYQINDLLVKLAREGKRVVRLKAGDPYVFGRGGEESQYLRERNVAFEVVPGITSAIAGLGAAGIPITHRDFASSFHIITGHHKAAGKELDWQNIAHQEGTIVFLMGMEELGRITQHLIENGKSPQTPVAVIQWATHWKQRAVKSDLANISQVVTENKMSSPALIVVGDVVSLMDELYPRLPLQGLHLLVPFKEPSQLFAKLQDQGAAVNFFDRRLKMPLKFDLPDISHGGTLVVTDFAAFHFFQQTLLASGFDHRALLYWQILTTNRMVDRKLRDAGIISDGNFDMENSQYRDPVIVLGEQQTLSHLPGHYSEKIATYQAKPVAQQIDLTNFHAVIFPSSASASDLVEGWDADQRQRLVLMPCFAMGTMVAEECHRLGLENVIAVEPTFDAVVNAVERKFQNESSRSTSRQFRDNISPNPAKDN